VITLVVPLRSPPMGHDWLLELLGAIIKTISRPDLSKFSIGQEWHGPKWETT